MIYLKLATAVILVTAVTFVSGFTHTPLFVLYLVLMGWTVLRESVSQFTYTAVLSLALYGALLFKTYTQPGPEFWAGMGQLGMMAVSALLMARALVSQRRKSRTIHGRLARAECLSAVADILNGTTGDYHEKICQATRIIAAEVGKEGVRCRVILHGEDKRFLPPSGGNLGIHLPIEAAGETQGTLILVGGRLKHLRPSDQDFFTKLTTALGLYLHREKSWEAVRNQIRHMETSILLETPHARYD